MPTAHREREKERRRKAVYEAATKILCKLGYEKASIRNIAEAMGMTKAGLYYYFESKEELLYQILNSYMDDLLAGIREINERISDPLSFIQECIRFQVNLYCRDKYRSKLIIHDENCLSGQYYASLKQKQREYLAFWREGLRKYCEKEGIKTAYLSVDVHFLVGMCNWIYQWYNAKGEMSPDQLAEHVFNIFFFGFNSSIPQKPA
jgi:AcrR family transcriptional regulator